MWKFQAPLQEWEDIWSKGTLGACHMSRGEGTSQDGAGLDPT